MADESRRNIGLLGATLIGVGAIVGGGVLALAGTAFASAGPAAIVAFALNGVIAFATARSFAGMARAFPQSGGSYNFAKMVLSVRFAFAVGWVVWFASIVAAVLYALGFAVYAVLVIKEIYSATGHDLPGWVGHRATVVVLAGLATAFYSVNLLRKSGGGGNIETVGKVIIFIMFIGFGAWALLSEPSSAAMPETFFYGAAPGLIAAMGFSFIALQGFDLIAAVGGEVREPQRNIPRAMYYSLVIALLIYMPLLFVVMTAGVTEGSSIVSMSEAEPDAVVAIAARNIVGDFGFWMIAVAALLAMLSALSANLFAASRISASMAKDRMLPWAVAKQSEKRGIPVGGVLASGGLVLAVLLVLEEVAVAGAAASLIFLLTFALVHYISFLARRRGAIKEKGAWKWLPVGGGLACIALAIFQGVVVPAAGLITVVWVAVGAGIYLTLFSHRAEAVDAGDMARNPLRSVARGVNPLVLLPIANPDSAAGLVSIAHALTPPNIGRVLLLSVIRKSEGDPADELKKTQAALGQTLTASFRQDMYPEALATVAPDPWSEIARVARTRDCRSLLLGMSKLDEQSPTAGHLEKLMSDVDSDVVVLRAKSEWQLENAKKILVPVGGKGYQDELRARMLGSLSRTAEREVTYLRVLNGKIDDNDYKRIEKELKRFAQGEAPGFNRVVLVRSENAIDEVIRECEQSDLTIIGVQRLGRRKKLFGNFAMQVVQKTTKALMLISRRG
ncbi:MAG: amino acid permease [Planctomycetes bacterium]|nr:amino acid permease [Planctomycetota bacterium]